LPTLIALGGTAGMVVLRRREAATFARRVLGALPTDGAIGAVRAAAKRAATDLRSHVTVGLGALRRA
jgi:hypothetical protein